MTSTFGGPVPTPNIDKLAANRPEVQPVPHHCIVQPDHEPRCSPAKSPLGRHGRGSWRWQRATLDTPQHPKEHRAGFADSAGQRVCHQHVREVHNTPEPDISPAGPFDGGPPVSDSITSMGSIKERRTSTIHNSIATRHGFRCRKLPRGLSLHRGHDRRSHCLDPKRPRRQPGEALVHLFQCTGVHAPHHAPKEWREKFVGKFDYGWDKQRELTYARQLEMGSSRGERSSPRVRRESLRGIR